MKHPGRSAPRHPIRVVAQRTGLKPALIRAWENRYQTVGPERSTGRHRLYSDDDVKRLLLLRKAVEGGRRISQVAPLSTRQLEDIAAEDEAARAEPLLAGSTRGGGDRADAEPPAMGRAADGPSAEPDRSAEKKGEESPGPFQRLLISVDALPDDPADRERLAAELTVSSLADLRRLSAELGSLRPSRTTCLTAGRLQVLLLIQETVTRQIAAHSRERGRDLLDSGLSWLAGRFGRDRVDDTFERFRELFVLPEPAQEDRSRTLLWLVFLWLANRNPAFEPYRDLFDDHLLESETGYRSLLTGLNDFFAEEIGSGGYLLGEMRRLFEASPEPAGQVDALGLLEGPGAPPTELLNRTADVLREESRPAFTPPGPAAAAAPPPEPPPSTADREDWRLSQERPWMSDVVLVAKNVLVWMTQLSRRFDREIERLDQIPDEILEEQRDLGFNALWLVGLWQRSRASARLKQRRRFDAVASAYAVDRYVAAPELGGPEALEDLDRRCRRIGLRLTCDLVPNHTSLDSPWVLRHPERFVSVDEPPFPGYSFTGEDLSPDPDVGLWLEDGYEDWSDAAVVFKRLDRLTGEARYLYHGNDGTALPWNDTAQLDYTRADVRRQMEEQILHLARRFSIIRLDAAMTLTRRHFQRLWYPPPGSGGAIPSRSEHGMSQEELDRRMPTELWVEVVDRLAEETPDTMLLAEAFWLMEPYFVRRLGVHRVYHSAFLHAVRDERNGDLKRWLRDCLALEPEELRRYVNFLTTPDEDPAASAFGKGDKLFAASTLLAALPGTPLFGHGQAHGLIEKYGMDYDRPYYTESADTAFAERHRREIVPLLRRRQLFSGTDRLRLYDVTDRRGRPADSVYALSNGDARQTVFVLVNNAGFPVRAQVRPTSEPFHRHGRLSRSPLPDLTGARDLRTGEPVELPSGPDGLDVELKPYGVEVLVIDRPFEMS